MSWNQSNKQTIEQIKIINQSVDRLLQFKLDHSNFKSQSNRGRGRRSADLANDQSIDLCEAIESIETKIHQSQWKKSFL